MPAEDLRIEALKRAIDIAKLMSNVTTQDVINIASKLLIISVIHRFKNNIFKLYNMNTTTLKERLGLDEEAVFEDGVTATDDGMTDEELKIESLKIATNIGKLMSNVTTEDIVSIAETVAKFIKGGEGASLETTNDDSSSDEDNGETEEDFNTEDEETPEETDEGTSPAAGEDEENFEV